MKSLVTWCVPTSKRPGKDTALTKSRPHSRLLPLGIAAILATPMILTQTRSAEAQVVRVRTHVRVRTPIVRWSWGWGRYWRPRVYRPHVRVLWGMPVYVGPTYYGGPFAQPPPPPPPAPADDCDCGNGPDVPIRSAYPRVAPPAAVVARPAQPMRRLAVGAFTGHTQVENDVEGNDVGLLMQYRLTGHLTLEGEIGKTSLADNARVDKRAGVALMYNFHSFFQRRSLSLHPFVVAGAGVSQVDMNGGDWSKGQGYGEVGGGLSLSLSRSISIALDVRAGVRALADRDDEPLAVRQMTGSTPPAAAPDREENYTRVRLGALLHF